MSTPRDDADDAVPHDAWLREALRHAPDAQALPPSALSEAILRQARAAAEPAPARALPSLGQRLAAAWAWLGRPPVAAGFATVMVAGVVGLMWWDRPLEETLPPRDAAVPSAAPAPRTDTRARRPRDHGFDRTRAGGRARAEAASAGAPGPARAGRPVGRGADAGAA